LLLCKSEPTTCGTEGRRYGIELSAGHQQRVIANIISLTSTTYQTAAPFVAGTKVVLTNKQFKFLFKIENAINNVVCGKWRNCSVTQA
jgi:hypothetical protein